VLNLVKLSFAGSYKTKAKNIIWLKTQLNQTIFEKTGGKMLFKNAYSTNGAIKNVHFDKVKLELEKYIINHSYFVGNNKPVLNISSDKEKLETISILTNDNKTESIPPFVHAVFNEDNKWAAFDFRYFTASKNEDYRIKNIFEYDLAINRFILSCIYRLGKTNELYRLSLAQEIFAKWLSSTISIRFGLMPQDMVRIHAYAYLYYASLFKNELTDDDVKICSMRFKKETYIIDNLIEDIYDRVNGEFSNIIVFCKNIEKVVDNVRLKNFDHNVLFNIIQTNWLSINGKEILFTSLEYPPNWISICYAALNIRNFNKSYIANIAEKASKKGKLEDFMDKYSAITNKYINNEYIKSHL